MSWHKDGRNVVTSRAAGRTSSRVLAFVLLALMLIISACGGATPTAEPDPAPAEEPAEEPAEAPAEEPTEAPAEEPTEEPAEEPTEEPAEEPTEEAAEEPAEEAAAEMGEIVPPLTVTVLTFPAYEEWWRQIPPELEAVGIELDLQPIEANTWIQQCNVERECGTFTSTGAGVTDDRIDPNWFLNEVLHSKRAAPGTGSNLSQWSNPEVDALIDAQAVELDDEARTEMIKEIQAIFASESPMIPVYFINDVQAYNKEKFEGVLPRAGAGITRFNNLTSFLNITPLTDDTVFNIENNHDGNSTNPFIASGGLFNTATMLWIYDTLARMDENLEVIPWAAESWEWQDDTTIDVTLREGMTFHDGEPVTLDDLIFTLEYAREHEFPTWAGIFDVVESVEAVDETTARFTLTAPFAPFVANILTAIYIVPQHIWQDVSDPMTFENPDAIGSGPFTFGHWRPNESWLFERNPNHFRPPSIDVLVAVIPTPETWIGMLQTGELDANGTYIRGDAQIDTLSAVPELELVTVPSLGVQSVYIDTTTPPGSDPAFRRAIHHLIPKESLLDVVAGKGGGFVAEANWLRPESPWYNPDAVTYEYDPEAARAILEEAGYTWDEDGRLHYPAGMSE